MLQIISEKFFDSQKTINKSVEHEVFYSNFYCSSPIKTKVFEVIPINPHPSKINKFLIKYENKYQPKDEKDIMVFATSEPILLHIQYLLTFHLNCYFHREKASVENLCSNNKNPKEKNNQASIHLPHIFDLKEDNFTSAETLIEFVNKVTLLNRKSYNLFIKLLKAYYTSVEAFETNYEISYMTLVYLLETFVSEMEKYEPTWEDFDQNRKIKLDKLFEQLDNEKAIEIKSILLKDSNLKLRKQFVNTLYDLTKSDFFTPSKSKEDKKILKSQLIHVLNNLYFIRSKYVHKLDSLEEVVQTHGFNKRSYIYDEDEPKFSIYGLTIYTQYILNSFLKECELLEFEDYPWRSELPGIIHVKLAPQYWVWKHEGLLPEHLNSKFNGFIDLLSREKTLLDIKELLLKIEKSFGQLNEKNFASAFCIYILFNTHVEEEKRLPNQESIINKYMNKTETCTIQYMAVSLFVSGFPKWSLSEQESSLDSYYNNKFKKQSISLPNILEISLLANLANQYLANDNKDKYDEFVERAILESCNYPSIYDYLDELRNEKSKIDLNKLNSDLKDKT